MQALRYDAQAGLSLQVVPVPRLIDEDEVLVKVAFAGICGTDLHIIEGSFPCKSSVVTLGHEFSGTAVLVGKNVKHIKPDDCVTVDPNSGCMKCSYCTRGNYHFCEEGGLNSTLGIYRDGGWAQYCLAPSSQVYKVSSDIPLHQASLTEPLSCLVHGWDRMNPITVGSKILVQGAGIIGNLWVAALHHHGHRDVIVTEPHEARRKLTSKLDTGFQIITPEELKDLKIINPSWGLDVIIDCSGYGPAIQEAVGLLNPGGRLCIFGVASPETRISVSPYLLFKKELSIIAVNINPFCFPKSIDLIKAMGKRYLEYEKLGIKTFSLTEYQEAIQELKEGTIAKAMFKFD